jgi:hypothetical protein
MNYVTNLSSFDLGLFFLTLVIIFTFLFFICYHVYMQDEDFQVLYDKPKSLPTTQHYVFALL